MEAIFNLINEMSPYLLLGFLLAGLMHAFIPGTLYSKYLSKSDIRSVLMATLLGIPLPLCSCGVIPTAMSLRKEGASKGATTAFLIATPQTGVDSIIATFALMGLPFAIIRPLAALLTAVFGGQMVNMVGGEDSGISPKRGEPEHSCCGAPSGSPKRGEPEHSCCCCHEEEEHEEHCCCHEEAHEEHCCCCHDDDEDDDDECGCGCGCHEHRHHDGFWGKMGEALRYAYIEMMEDIGKWLVIGLVIAGLITVCVPDSFFEVFKDNSLLSMLLVLCMAIPMYLCATGSIPIAVALILKGLTPGAGLVLLMAGPACNFASMLVISKVMGRRTLVTYLASIIVGAVAFGLIIDHMLPVEWFTSSLTAAASCHEEETDLFSVFCTSVLGLLLLNALYKHYFKHESACHCH